MELRLYRKFLVPENLAKGRHDAVGADGHGHGVGECQVALGCVGVEVPVGDVDLVSKEALDFLVDVTEVFWRGFFPRLEFQGAGKFAAMAQGLGDLYRFQLA